MDRVSNLLVQFPGPLVLRPSPFGLPMEDLVRLMSQWQERAMALQRAPRAL